MYAQFASAAGVVVCLLNILIGPLAALFLSVVQQDYRYIFLLSSTLACLGLVATVFLYRAFVARGGDKNYVPPEYQHLPVKLTG